MTLPHVPLLAALLLTACSSGANEAAAPTAQETSPARAPTPQASSPVPVPVSLQGEYRVAGVDGEDLDAPTGVTVTITAGTIELARCAGLAWTYSYEAGRLETKAIPRTSDDIMCRIPEEASRVGSALGEADHVGQTSANGLEFSGGGRSVLLFSQ